MSYKDTFVQVALDCPATRGVVPVGKGERQPIHVIQYELLSKNPYRFTDDDLLYEVHVRHKEISLEERQTRAQEIRDELLANPHPCMRASLLPKKYGWGVHYDGKGRLALYPSESAAYARFTQAGSGVTLVYALRSKSKTKRS